MRLSVIISTYNSPDWLEKVLWGYSAQSHRNFELLVADDGSTDETRRSIDTLRGQTGMTIRHIWHEDRGFRKCTILNRAIESAAADYLVFSDGDCIPRCDFLQTHARQARLGCFLSGGLFRLPIDVSRRINKDDITRRPHHQRSLAVRCWRALVAETRQAGVRASLVAVARSTDHHAAKLEWTQ